MDNAIKNTEEGENIKVHTTIEQDFATILIINKPKMIYPQIIQKIQQLFLSATAYENSENDSLGFGIILINEFVKSNNGTVSLLHDTDNNLVFKVRFPTI